jgi:hypothetical protein
LQRALLDALTAAVIREATAKPTSADSVSCVGKQYVAT